jgi:hypothetical protein
VAKPFTAFFKNAAKLKNLKINALNGFNALRIEPFPPALKLRLFPFAVNTKATELADTL